MEQVDFILRDACSAKFGFHHHQILRFWDSSKFFGHHHGIFPATRSGIVADPKADFAEASGRVQAHGMAVRGANFEKDGLHGMVMRQIEQMPQHMP